MLVYCTKREKKTLEEARKLNDIIAGLVKDLQERGIKMIAKEWKDLVSGRVKDLREFLYLKWSRANSPAAYSNYMEYLNTGAFCIAPKVLKQSRKYEQAFNGRAYDALFEFEYDKAGVPRIDLSKLKAAAPGMYTLHIDDLTEDEIKDLKDKCRELTERLHQGDDIAADMEPGFRITPNPEPAKRRVEFNACNYYRDIASQLIEIRESTNL